jgi:hypothetical protein
MAKTSVRVTMFADPIEVDEDEIPGLRAQGLLIEDNPASSEPDTSSRPRRGSGQSGDGSGLATVGE